MRASIGFISQGLSKTKKKVKNGLILCNSNLHSRSNHYPTELAHEEKNIRKDDTRHQLSPSSAQEYKEDWSSQFGALHFHPEEALQLSHSIE